MIGAGKSQSIDLAQAPAPLAARAHRAPLAPQPAITKGDALVEVSS